MSVRPVCKAVIPPHRAESAAATRHSPGVLVESAQTLFISGQIGRDAAGQVIADPEAQYVAIFQSLKEILGRAGADFGDVVKLNSYHLSFDDFATFASVKDRYINGPVLPAWTAVGVTALVIPGFLAEVDCTAVVDPTKSR